MKYLVVIIMIVLLFLILKNNLSEKFNQELVSPEIIEAVKEGKTAFIKFKNDSKQIRKFMIFYIDTEAPQSGIWVEKEIECSEEICNVELNDLDGARYHLVIVETDGKNMSSIGKIVKFGNGSPYTPYHITPIGSDLESTVEKKTNIVVDTGEDEGQISFTKENEEDESDTPSPFVECGRNPKVRYVEDKTDMENIEVRSKCIDDPEIADLKVKTGRSLWDEFKKGHLTLDLNYENE